MRFRDVEGLDPEGLECQAKKLEHSPMGKGQTLRSLEGE